MQIVLLLLSLVIILAGAEIFTNGVEWLGKKLKLSEGAVGSILAAVGTALPETMVPVMAILFGTGEDAEHIGIGAILGAPFMLSTLAMGITGIAAIGFKYKGRRRTHMLIDPVVVKRDLGFFIIVYTVAILAAFSPKGVHFLFVIGLVAAYIVYAVLTVRHNRDTGGEHENPAPLRFSPKAENPSLRMVLIQVLAALALIILGADLFVEEIQNISTAMGIPAFVLSIIIAPIATELPEKFNSIIWVKHGKDTLAMGNITGAMVFQSSLIPALGIALTSWTLTPLAILNACIALTSSVILFCVLHFAKKLPPWVLVCVISFYLFFLVVVLTGRVS
ncbi:MAG: sodium:calcium antiporter, partial [Bacillota bacterium]|nr:sodium:calcium antiporter [Bacillota bacterium]